MAGRILNRMDLRRQAELAEEDGVFENGGGAHVVEGLFLLETLDGLDADFRVFGVGGVDGYDFCGANGGFAHIRVVDDEFFAGLHAAEIEQGGGVGDSVPGGLAVAHQVIEGVGGGLGFQKIGHGSGSVSGRVPPLRVNWCKVFQRIGLRLYFRIVLDLRSLFSRDVFRKVFEGKDLTSSVNHSAISVDDRFVSANWRNHRVGMT